MKLRLTLSEFKKGFLWEGIRFPRKPFFEGSSDALKTSGIYIAHFQKSGISSITQVLNRSLSIRVSFILIGMLKNKVYLNLNLYAVSYGKKPRKKILEDIASALEIFPSVVKQKERAWREKEKVLKRFAPVSKKLLKIASKPTSGKSVSGRSEVRLEAHPWRLCPLGQHWVKKHPMHVPVSVKNPDGMTLREGHCRDNPSKKDQLYADEIRKIAELNFKNLKLVPKDEDFGKKHGNDFDQLIAGWTQYWNEVLRPSVKLEPNLVKALVFTESNFKPDAKALASKGNWARGLMQVTDETFGILKDEKGELKDSLININQKDAYDPNLNICAGIRWLFHKKRLLERRKRREVTWSEAAMEYKSFTKDLAKKKTTAIREQAKFQKALEVLNK